MSVQRRRPGRISVPSFGQRYVEAGPIVEGGERTFRSRPRRHLRLDPLYRPRTHAQLTRDLEYALVALGECLADTLLDPLVRPGATKLHSLRASPLDAHGYALADYVPLKLCEGARYLEQQLAHWAGGIEALLLDKHVDLAGF